MIQIKICGNVYLRDSWQVANAKPHYMGWIFVPQSPRKVSIKRAKHILSIIRFFFPSIKHVAVVGAQEIDEIIAIVKKIPYINYLQIIGDASYFQKVCDALSEHNLKNQIKCILVIRVAKPVSNKELIKQQEIPFLILDSFHTHHLGGTGNTIPLSYIKDIKFPYFLAGGLHAGNIIKILTKSSASKFMIGVDVSSGMEFVDNSRQKKRVPGRKNIQEVKEFIKKVKTFEDCSANDKANSSN